MKKNNEIKENKLMIHFKQYKQPYLIGVGFVLWFVLLLFLATLGQKPPYNNIAVSFFGLSIAWYAIFILSGIGFAVTLAHREAHFLDINVDHFFDSVLFGIPIGVIGARIYYVIFEPVDSFAEVFNIAGGGLAIHGVIIAVLIFILIYTKIRKINLFAFLDLIAPGFLIAQVLGRWGNFFNQEAHGGPIKPETLKVLKKVMPNFIIENMNINGTYFHPTFLYEGLWNFLGFVLILIFRRKRVFKLGDIFGFYLIWYGLGRGLLIEPFRTDPLLIGETLRVNVLFSLTLFVLGGVAYIVVKNIIRRDLPYYIDVVRENEEQALKKLSEKKFRFRKKTNSK